MNVFKGITSRIYRLLFVNTTFKVGHSSPSQSARASGGTMCLASGTGCYVFYRVPHLTFCVLPIKMGNMLTAYKRDKDRSRATGEDKSTCEYYSVSASSVYTS